MTIGVKSHPIFLFLSMFQLLVLSWQVTAKITLPDVQANSTVSVDDDTFHALIDYGIDLVHAEHYEEALEGCKKLMFYYPESPVGYFYTASLYQIIMRNYRVKTFEPQFERFIDLAVEEGECAVKKDRKDAVSYLYLGGAYGYRALHKIRKHKWFSAFKDGLKSISRLEKAIEAEPTLYDTYYGLGTYHYWRSAKSKTLWFLPFIGDERQKGIDELWQSITIGTCMAGLIDYIMITYVLKYEKVAKLKQTKTYKYCAWLYNKIAFISLVIAGFTPIPFEPFRFLAAATKYNRVKYVLAVFIGRAPRYYLLAKLQRMFHVPRSILIGSILLILIIVLIRMFWNRRT